MSFTEYQHLYFKTLIHDVIPFWLKYSKDHEYGGYFTCLNREGKVYDTDKFVWLQCRQVWCFSMLYNKVEKNPQWLDFAIHGANFLMAHGRDPDGNWYFALDRQGKPLTEPYNIFSDCFAAMAFGQLYQATQDKTYSEVSVSTFRNILRRQSNPKGQYSKSYPGTRPLRNFALPMILCNLVLEIEPLIDHQLVRQTISSGVHSVMDVFYHPETGLILENVLPGGVFSDSFEGRLLNPGHGLEAMWFIMDLAERISDESLINKAVDTALNILDYGWDKKFGGIFYFLDIKGHPQQQLEWDQKLWWVHIEAMISQLKGYLHTGNPKCWDWFEKIHHYTWQHFPDPQNGEWFGYLNRQGEVLLPLKGGKWKGCFHIPRGLFQCWKALEAIAEKSSEKIYPAR